MEIHEFRLRYGTEPVKSFGVAVYNRVDNKDNYSQLDFPSKPELINAIERLLESAKKEFPDASAVNPCITAFSIACK